MAVMEEQTQSLGSLLILRLAAWLTVWSLTGWVGGDSLTPLSPAISSY